MITKRIDFTEAHKEEILKLFYRTELRENEKVIDNTTPKISKELGISISIVNEFLGHHLEEKFIIINNRL